MMNLYSLLMNYILPALSLLVSLLIYIKHIGKLEFKSIPLFKATLYVMLILLSIIPLLFHTNLARLSKLVVLLSIVKAFTIDHLAYALLKGLGILYTISIPFDWLYPYLGRLSSPFFSIVVFGYIFLYILIIGNHTKNISMMFHISLLFVFVIEGFILITIKVNGAFKLLEGFIANMFVFFNIFEALLYELYVKLRNKNELTNFLNKKKLLLNKIFSTKEKEINNQTIYSYITQHMINNEETGDILEYIQLIDISWNIFINYTNKLSEKNHIELSFEIEEGEYHILNEMVLTSLLYTVEYLIRGNHYQLISDAKLNIREYNGSIVINAFVDCCKNELCYLEEQEVDIYMRCYVKKANASLNKYIDNEKAFINFTIPISGLNQSNQSNQYKVECKTREI